MTNEASKITVTEFTDPICSIAWGTEPKRRLLEWRYGDRLNWRVVMSGLVDNLSTRDGWDEAGGKAAFGADYQKVWQGVSGMTGMPYPVNLQYMAMTTLIPCRVIKAAERQGHGVAARVLRRLREEVFLYGVPVDDFALLPQALEAIEGLDFELLMKDYESAEVESAFQSDWEETRQPNDYVRRLTAEGIERLKGSTMVSEGRERYVLPTYIFEGPCGEITVPGWRGYAEYESAIEQVLPGFIGAEDRTYPTQAEAFMRWNTMTGKELDFLCGASEVPEELASEFDWGEGKVWLQSQDIDHWHKRMPHNNHQI